MTVLIVLGSPAFDMFYIHISNISEYVRNVCSSYSLSLSNIEVYCVRCIQLIVSVGNDEINQGFNKPEYFS